MANKVSIPVSREGLTACPRCRSHLQFDHADAELRCPFCDAHVATAATQTAALGATSRRSMLLSSLGTGATLAASLGIASAARAAFGIAAGPVSQTPTVVAGAPPAVPKPVYGLPPRPRPKPTPKPKPKPEPGPEPQPEPGPEPQPEPGPEPQPEPVPDS